MDERRLGAVTPMPTIEYEYDGGKGRSPSTRPSSADSIVFRRSSPHRDSHAHHLQVPATRQHHQPLKDEREFKDYSNMVVSASRSSSSSRV